MAYNPYTANSNESGYYPYTSDTTTITGYNVPTTNVNNTNG